MMLSDRSAHTACVRRELWVLRICYLSRYKIERIEFSLVIDNTFYYLNTNDIPGEPSRENMTPSHVKRSPSLLWLHDKSRLSPVAKEKYSSGMVWYFIGVYVMNRTMYGRLKTLHFSSRIPHLKRHFVSLRGNVISSIII